MGVTLSQWLTSINYSKEDLMVEKENEKDYVPYIVNRCLSYFPDTIYHAQEMNLRGMLPKEMQFQYLLGSVRKKKRFSPWDKKATNEDLRLVKEYFGYSDRKAIEALELISPEQMELIKERLSKGGVKK